MLMYTFRRTLMLIPVLLGVSLLTFLIAQVTPGDPVILMLGKNATPEKVAEMRHQLGYDQPLPIQYGRYIWNALHGDLGVSIRGQASVMKEILLRFPSTLELTLAAMFLSMIGGIGFGVAAATARNKFVEGSTMVIALVGLSIPGFWLAILLIIVFGIRLQWVSVTGGEGFKDLILPAFTLALAPTAVIARLTRSSIKEVIREDFVRTARAKGLNWRRVIRVHVLKNSLIPVVTVLGMQFANMLGGALFIENIFARPGLGRLAVNAILARDFPQVQGIVLFAATVYVILNLLVDLLYAVLDPRIRYD